MKKTSYLLLTMVFISATAMKTGMPAYNLFDKKGKEAKYKHLVKDAAEADVVLFGELHNNPIGHWLQLELTKSLYDEKNGNIVLGAEMFEADNQLLLDEYITGLIRERNFENEAKLWDNYQTDYKPLVEFAKKRNLKFVATNIPRRYASLVHQQGFEALDSLPATARAYIAPLPVLYDPELPGYKGMLAMMGDMGHANDNLPKAQAIKDATMAHFILENLEPGQTLIHYNGAYHSNNFEGIYWYLKQMNPELKILTITSVEQDTISDLTEENTGVAGYTICIPSTMTKTY